MYCSALKIAEVWYHVLDDNTLYTVQIIIVIIGMMLQIIRRKRFFKIPMQANYYPIPTMAFIQDEAFRFTIVTAQPLGVASLKEGQIEVSHWDKILLGQTQKYSV